MGPESLEASGVDPLDTVRWERRDVRIEDGDRVVFAQRGVEVPADWSPRATTIVAQRYFRGALGAADREQSVKQVIRRVVNTIVRWGRHGGYFASTRNADDFAADLSYMLVHQVAAFNSPVWFNVGFEERAHANSTCILSVQDDLESIIAWSTDEIRVFVGAGGCGVNLSNLRGSAEPMSRGGSAVGPVAFMRAPDAWAGTIAAGGRTRRAAKMIVLDVDHPDIHEFIWCKAHEEDKARALLDAGFDASIGNTAVQYQHANNSVRVSDDFMRAVEVDGDWRTVARTTGRPIGPVIRARDLLRSIAAAAWHCADPGLQFDTTINRWHTCPESGRINASTSCAEYMHVDDSACNLASLNLCKFRRRDGTFDVSAFMHAVDVLFLAQEILIGGSAYPSERVARNTLALRPVGLGFTNLGALLMANGLPYDSPAGRGTAAAIAALMTARAYLRSAHIAAAMSPYDEYPPNAQHHHDVLRRHQTAAHLIADESVPDRRLLRTARETWDEAVMAGERHGFRNAQATLVAPAGTISLLMDCDTTGIEPDFALVKTKYLAGGGSMTSANGAIPLALRTLGYAPRDIERVRAHVLAHGTAAGAPGLASEHQAVFDVAVGHRAIHHTGHVGMLAAVQPCVSGAIAKTVNMPRDATVDDVMDTYMRAWRTGVKAVAIYRDGCKVSQALRPAVGARRE